MVFPEAVPGQVLEAALATDSYGPTACLVGFELDYSLEEYSLNDCSPEAQKTLSEEVIKRRTAFEAVTRRRAYDQISALQPQNDEEADRQTGWLEQVDALTRPELVMFVAHSYLARPTLSPGHGDLQKAFTDIDPQNTIEYRFGKGKYQTGYYDNEPEIRTMPASPAVALERRQYAMATYRYLALQLGMEVSFGSDDTNVSFWQKTPDGYELAHGLETEEQALFSRDIGRAMMLALRDSNPAFVPYEVLAQNNNLVWSMGQYRSTSLRVTPTRFEHRAGRGENEDASLRLAALVGGFICGRQNPTGYRDIAQAPAFRPSESYRKETDIHVLRAIEHSGLSRTGYLRLDESYATARAPQIMKALVDCAVPAELEHSVARTMGLVRTIRYQDGHLHCNPVALGLWKSALGQELVRQLEEDHGAQLSAEYINARLAKVAYAGGRYVIEGFFDDELSRADRFAAGLERYVASPMLDVVTPRAERARIAEARMAWFQDHQNNI